MKKKILLVGSFPLFGGGEVYLFSLVKLLVKNGYHVEVACCSDELIRLLQENSIKVINFPKRFYPNFAIIVFKLLWYLKINNVHHVHLNGEREIHLAPFLSLFGSKLTSTRHTWLYSNTSLKNRIKNWLSIKCLEFADNICVSQSLREILEEAGVSKKKLIGIPNFPDPKFLDAYSPLTNVDRIHFVMLARIDFQKGQQDLIRACIGIDNIKLTFVGDGDSSVLETEQNDVSFEHKGFSANPIHILQTADIVVLPSYFEGGCPLALMEGMALGKPVIASSIPTIKELVRDGIDGILINPGDIDGLREAILKMRDKLELRQSMGAHAHKRILENFVKPIWEEQTSIFFSRVNPI